MTLCADPQHLAGPARVDVSWQKSQVVFKLPMETLTVSSSQCQEDYCPRWLTHPTYYGLQTGPRAHKLHLLHFEFGTMHQCQYHSEAEHSSLKLLKLMFIQG